MLKKSSNKKYLRFRVYFLKSRKFVYIFLSPFNWTVFIFSPVVKTLDYDSEDAKENSAPPADNNFLKPPGKPITAPESPMTSFLGPARKSLAVPKPNLMSFDSPSTPSTPRRSTRLSSAQKINYKETELFKRNLEVATAQMNLLSPSTPRARSRSPSPAFWNFWNNGK